MLVRDFEFRPLIDLWDYLSLILLSYKWWELEIKTWLNVLFRHVTHQKWIIGDRNRVIDDEN